MAVGVIGRNYDSLNRLRTVAFFGSGIAARMTEYRYDDQNGRLAAVESEGIRHEFEYLPPEIRSHLFRSISRTSHETCKETGFACSLKECRRMKTPC